MHSNPDPALRWLIIGADSLIGTALHTTLKAHGAKVTGTSRRPGSLHQSLDIAVEPGQWHLPDCDIAIICAAESRLADCERDPQTTARINVAAPLALSLRIRAKGGFVVFISSSSVFDGLNHLPSPDTPPAPIHAYGQQKAEAEDYIREATTGHGLAIVRPTKILSRHTPLLREWEIALASATPITPHAWRWMAPLHLDAAVEGIIAIAASRADGIWHLSGAEDINYADFALCWASTLNYPSALIVPQTGENALAQRARLDMSTTTRRFGIASPGITETIAALQREST